MFVRRLTVSACLIRMEPYTFVHYVLSVRGWSMLTPFGRLLVTVSLVVVLLATLVYFFVVTRHGQNFLCQRGQLCLNVSR